MSSDPILEAYTSRKIIVELDYGHFLSPAGWLNLIQIVSTDTIIISNEYLLPKNLHKLEI